MIRARSLLIAQKKTCFAIAGCVLMLSVASSFGQYVSGSSGGMAARVKASEFICAQLLFLMLPETHIGLHKLPI
jgi:hypothetical protein